MATQCVTAQIAEPPYGLNRLPHLGSSLLQILIPNEVQSMWKEEPWQTDAGRSARTLVKYPDLRIVLVSMKAGTSFKQQKTSARFALLTLAGHIRLRLPNATVEVPRGELLALDRDVSHDVEAIRQSTFLLFLPGLSGIRRKAMREFIHELRHDHRVIQQVVAGMSAVAELLDSGKQVDPSVLIDVVQFLRVFADQCHHEKEDQYLFPVLATKANLSTRRELESLEREHRSTKQLVDQLAKVAAVYSDNPAAVRYRVIDLLQRLVELYPAHIWKEDFLLFPLAQQNLSLAEQQNLEEMFADVEREVGEDVHAGFEMLGKKLEAVVEYRNTGACPLCSSAA